MSKIISALAAGAIASALAFPTVSHASDTSSRVVSYGELNVASPAGKAILKHRIRSAVDSLCDASDSRDVQTRIAARECRAEAMNGATPAYESAVNSVQTPTVAVAEATTTAVPKG